MTGRLYCIDNDIIQKLATFELFDETIALFKASRSEVRVLETAKYKFRNLQTKNRAEAIRPEAKFVNYAKAIELAEALPSIPAMADDVLFTRLSDFEDIQAGEATLTAYAAQFLSKRETSDAFILTGDKRYLRKLASIRLRWWELSAFHHRFWCLEQLVLWNIREYGFEAVRKKVVPVRDCDQACKAIFGSRSLSTEENAIAAAIGYIEALRKETGVLLHPYPN